MKMKIKTCITSGLGNQMFQFAFGKALSLFYNCPLIVDASYYQKFNSRRYMLDLFDIHPTEETSESFVLLEEKRAYRSGDEKRFFSLGGQQNYQLFGFWQHLNYFKTASEALREIFYLEPKALHEDDLVLHVRRGDYVNNSAYEFCDVDWYQRAVSMFDYKNLYIISDDPNWCRNNLCFPKTTVVDVDEKEALQFFYGSKNLIISNSSFSWWGAWYSNAKNIICPTLWLPANRSWKPQLKSWIQLGKPFKFSLFGWKKVSVSF